MDLCLFQWVFVQCPSRVKKEDEFPVEKHQKPDTKVFMLYSFIYIMFKNR